MKTLFLGLAALAGASAAAAADTSPISFTVDRSDRKVYVREGDEIVRTHDVAVGKEGHETPLGRCEFHQVDLNPDWTPPDSEWAKDNEWTPPGSPDNPMGRARLVFNKPYTIHGTRDTASLGKAASHGSIRIANPVVIELAELLLKEGGAWQGDQWFARMLEDPGTMHQIPLDRKISIEIVE